MENYSDPASGHEHVPIENPQGVTESLQFERFPLVQGWFSSIAGHIIPQSKKFQSITWSSENPYGKYPKQKSPPIGKHPFE